MCINHVYFHDGYTSIILQEIILLCSTLFLLIHLFLQMVLPSLVGIPWKRPYAMRVDHQISHYDSIDKTTQTDTENSSISVALVSDQYQQHPSSSDSTTNHSQYYINQQTVERNETGRTVTQISTNGDTTGSNPRVETKSRRSS